MNGPRAAVLAEGFTFLEGPRWDAGRLLLSDFHTNRVISLDEQGGTSLVCEVPGQPSGIGVLPDGSLLVVSMRERRIYHYRDSELCVYADLSDYARYPLNDMLLDAQARAYVGNLGFDAGSDAEIEPTTIFRVDPDGSIHSVAQDLVFPNGMALTGDGRLLVAETFASRITCFDLAQDGSLSNRRVWAELGPVHDFRSIDEALASSQVLPDGIALDAEGALWVGDAGGHAALRVHPGGHISDRVSAGPQTVYATALGGKDGRTLFMCSATPMEQRRAGAPSRAAVLACAVRRGEPSGQAPESIRVT